MFAILLCPVRTHKKLKGVGDRVRRSLYAHTPRKLTRSAQRLEDVNKRQLRAQLLVITLQSRESFATADGARSPLSWQDYLQFV
jgi:peptide methionine sulfoxide reductase MsrA